MVSVRRRLLAVDGVGRESHREGLFVEEARGNNGVAAEASPSASNEVDNGDGMETPPLPTSTAGALHNRCEEDVFFDLGNGPGNSSEDGYTSSSSSVSKGHNFGGDELNNGEPHEAHGVGYDKEMLSSMVDDGDLHKTVNEFWMIANKTFASEEEAFTFYNNYAKDKGFGVRKEKVRRSKWTGALLFRRFVCAREGERLGKWLEKDEYSRRPRALTRCHCPALLDIKLDISRGVWFVNNFVDEHNHVLATPDQVPFLWSHRTMKDFHKIEIMSLESAGVRKHVIRDVLQCRFGGYDKVGIVSKDIYNYSSRQKMSIIAEGDARKVLGLMLWRQKTDPDYFFDYQLDGEGRLMSMFWCDTQSRMDYQSFGDVVVFDSTYRMNRYKMPFVPFVGLNHHRSTTVFGCAIVRDERAESYVWVLRAFLKAMCQQLPHSIITDGDGSMIKAIRQVLSGVNHRICSWHVEKNIQKHLHSKSALKQFRRLMYYASSSSFEVTWNAFIANYRTAKNGDWLTMMYKNKELWAAAFQCNKFFLGMKSNQRSESLNSSLHLHLDIGSCAFNKTQRHRSSLFTCFYGFQLLFAAA